MSTSDHYAHRIKHARRRAGLTQDQLAELVGVHRDSISNWETGKHSPDGALPRLEQVLHVTLSDDVNGDMPETPTLESILERLRAAERAIDQARAITRVLIDER